jgi:L-lysine exporter family protein LysE/ArgO
MRLLLFTSFLEGFLLGMGAAIPLGPINILIMNHALREYTSAVIIGLGAMSADILYLVLILLGISAVFNQPLIFNLLGALGSTFLLYLSYLIFKGRNNPLHSNKEKLTPKNLFAFYLQGFVLTFINPYTVAFWLSIAGYTAHRNLDPFMTITGMICAIFLWITLMPYFVHRSKHRITQKTAYYFNLFSSILLLGFGLSLAVNLLMQN